MDKKIGIKIKEFREHRKISIEELSKISQLPVELLKKIEEDEIIPNLYYLTKIARVLSTRIGTFLDDSNESGCVITRANKYEQSDRFVDSERIPQDKMIFYSLGKNKKDRNMEPFVISVSASEKNNLSSHEGEEFIYILSGAIAVDYGKNYYELAQGDSIYFDSIIPHRIYSLENREALILAVLYIPWK